MFSCNRATLINMIRNYRLLCFAIGLEVLWQFFNQQEAKPKPVTLCTLSRAMNKLWVTATNSDHLNLLSAPVAILLVTVMTLVSQFI